MCRLMAFAARSETTFQRLLGSEQCSQFRRLTALHADGWGTAAVDRSEGDLRRSRSVSAPCEGLERTMASPAIARTIHLRMATSGMDSTIMNTHPFMADGLSFSHNGAITPVDSLAALVLPDFIAAGEGETDSELYFALIRQHINLGASVLDATCTVVDTLRSLFPRASLNAVLLGADELIVVHSAESAPVPDDEFEDRGYGAGELPPGHGADYYQLFRMTTADAVVFASAGLDTSSWEPVAPATVTRVGLRDLGIETRHVAQPPYRAV